MSFSEKCCRVFEQATKAYHLVDRMDATVHNPYEVQSIEFYLYMKNWIDAVQWHMENHVRSTTVQPEQALDLLRRIDKLNMDRTDLVELIDSFFVDQYKSVKVRPEARLNTESPAWAIDRLSILILKIYHMKKELEAIDRSEEYRVQCKKNLEQLIEQKKDLSIALDQLLMDIRAGYIYMKAYKQIKMYDTK